MNILFLTRYPINGASSRYRVYQYLPHLQKAGVSCHSQSFMSERMYQLSFQKGQVFLKAWLTLLAIIKRLWLLRTFKSYDVIYMQRELFPIGPPIIESLLKKLGATLVFDYDDALFIHKNSEYNRLASFFRSANKTLEIFKLSDSVLAGNNFLRDAAKPYCQNAITFEVAEDTYRIQQRPAYQAKNDIIIGWLGSKSTAKYLKTIAPALQQIKKQYPQVRFQVMGADPSFAIESISIEHLTWSLENELFALREFDIGIMPLPLEEWSKGKSGGKARTYMAAGVVPVCTGIGYNLELIQHGKTGFLCETQEQWIKTLTQLIESPKLCQRVSDDARAYVIEHFDVKNKALEMKQLLENTINQKANNA